MKAKLRTIDPAELIPHADDFRTAADAVPEEVVTGWLDYTLRHLGHFLHRHGAMLGRGDWIDFEYPTVRDGGRYFRIWLREYEQVVRVLEARGYWVKVRSRAGMHSPGLSICVAARGKASPPPAPPHSDGEGRKTGQWQVK